MASVVVAVLTSIMNRIFAAPKGIVVFYGPMSIDLLSLFVDHDRAVDLADYVNYEVTKSNGIKRRCVQHPLLARLESELDNAVVRGTIIVHNIHSITTLYNDNRVVYSGIISLLTKRRKTCKIIITSWSGVGVKPFFDLKGVAEFVEATFRCSQTLKSFIVCMSAMYSYTNRMISNIISRPLTDRYTWFEREMEASKCKMTLMLLSLMANPPDAPDPYAFERSWIQNCARHDYKNIREVCKISNLWSCIYMTIEDTPEKLEHKDIGETDSSSANSIRHSIDAIVTSENTEKLPSNIHMEVLVESAMNSIIKKNTLMRNSSSSRTTTAAAARTMTETHQQQLDKIKGLDEIVRVADVLHVCMLSTSDVVFESGLQPRVWQPILNHINSTVVDIAKGYVFADYTKETLPDQFVALKLEIYLKHAAYAKRLLACAATTITKTLNAVEGDLFKTLKVQQTRLVVEPFVVVDFKDNFLRKMNRSESTKSAIRMGYFNLAILYALEFFVDNGRHTPTSLATVRTKILAPISSCAFSATEAECHKKTIESTIRRVETKLSGSMLNCKAIAATAEIKTTLLAALNSPSTTDTMKLYFIPWLLIFCKLLTGLVEGKDVSVLNHIPKP